MRISTKPVFSFRLKGRLMQLSLVAGFLADFVLIRAFDFGATKPLPKFSYLFLQTPTGAAFVQVR
jgi:hypothetical protein